MRAPTSRLLELLEVLQDRPLVTGREIGERLGVDRRTVRRYVATLQALGIPVEGERGVGGGYRMRPGYRLPPLMVSDDEAVALVLGLSAVRHLGLDTGSDAADGALAKLHRVLPDALRRRVEALEATVGFTAPPEERAPVAGEDVLLLADAIRRGRRVRAVYRSHAGGETSRELSALGLVVHSGRWYLAAHDHGRDAPRTFRVDRLRTLSLAEEAAAPRPQEFDAVAHVSRSLASVPWRWEVEVLLELEPDEAARRLPATLAELAKADGGTLVRMRVDSLDWMATVLAGLGCGFVIRTPDELRASVATLARSLAERAAAQES